MRTQKQIARFNDLRRVANFYKETILCDFTGPDGVLTVDLQVPGIGKVRKLITPEGEVFTKGLN